MMYSGAISFDQPVRPISSFAELDYPYPSNYWTGPGGEQIAYGEIGNGKQNILMLHGLASYGPAWIRLADQLSEQYRCIIPDFPGHGHSELGDFEVSMPSFVALISSMIRDLSLHRPVVAGHSMGGQVAMQLALDYPDLVDRLILIAPYGLETFTERERQILLETFHPVRMSTSTIAEIQQNFMRNFHSVPGEAAFLLRHRIQMQYAEEFSAYCQMVQESVRALLDAPLDDRISALNSQALCVFGLADQIIPHTWIHGGSVPKLLNKAFAGCSGIETELIEGAGHYVHLERPERLKNSILAWDQKIKNDG